jgi:fumarylacetoacetate (FAA) hydrolase
MKLASLKNGTRDGQLVVVSKDLSSYAPASEVAPTLQVVLDQWDALAPKLASIYKALNEGRLPQTTALDPEKAMAPLPRAYQW